MKISKDKAVSIDYTLKNTKGEVLDSSIGSDPLSYIQGSGSIIVGLEKALEGRSKGETFNITILPEDAYGVYIKDLEMTLTKEYFKDLESLEPGVMFQIETKEGLQAFTIVSVEGENVNINGNHPLAGETLLFDIEVKDVREAAKEELEHGHVHTPHHHH